MDSNEGGDIAYGLVHAYDSDDPEFVRGAEVGALEAKVQLLGDVAIHDVMRRSNSEMVRRIAQGARRDFSISPIDDTWMDVTIEPVGAEPTRNGATPAAHLRPVE